MDYYNILEIDKNASLVDIKKAYKKLALKYHPDKNPNTDSNYKFQQISTAYQILSNDESKRKYDLLGEIPDINDIKTGEELFKELFNKFEPEIGNFLNNTFTSITNTLQNTERYDGFWSFINKVDTGRIIEEGKDVIKNVISKKIQSSILKNRPEDLIQYIYDLNLELENIELADNSVNEISLDYDFLRKYLFIKLNIKEGDKYHRFLLDLEYDLHNIKINNIDYDFQIEYKFPNNLKKYKNNDLLLELPLSCRNSIKPFNLKYKLSKNTTLDYNIVLSGQSNLIILDNYGILNNNYKLGKLYIIFNLNDDTVVNNYNSQSNNINGIKTIDLI